MRVQIPSCSSKMKSELVTLAPSSQNTTGSCFRQWAWPFHFHSPQAGWCLLVSVAISLWDRIVTFLSPGLQHSFTIPAWSQQAWHVIHVMAYFTKLQMLSHHLYITTFSWTSPMRDIGLLLLFPFSWWGDWGLHPWFPSSKTISYWDRGIWGEMRCAALANQREEFLQRQTSEAWGLQLCCRDRTPILSIITSFSLTTVDRLEWILQLVVKETMN